jgi:ADP-ribose pyrophosphatase
MPERSWTLLGSRDIADHRIFSIRYDRYRFEPTGAESDFVTIDSTDWVNVVPLTAEGEVVLVRQYRHAVRRVSLEIPGGMIDGDESPTAAAARELREETGFEAPDMRLLGRVRPNPAVQTNFCYFFLAEGCRQVAPPQLDPLERIEVVLRPLHDIPQLIRREEIFHTLVINAFAYMGIVPEPQ